MESFFRKYRWLLALGLIALGALLLALMVNNVVASRLAPYTVPELPSFAAVEKAPEPRRSSNTANWAKAIAERCFFGCPEEEPADGCPDGCGEGEECQNGICVPLAEEGDEIASDVPVPSDMNIKLLGAMVANRAEWSQALLMDDRSKQTYIASPGDVLPEGAEVVEIRRDRVIFSRNNRLEFIKMDASISGNPQPSAVSARHQPVTGANPPTTTTRSAPVSAEAAPSPSKAVKKNSESSYTVERQAIEQQLEDPMALARQARIIPNYKDGEKAGLKLVGISPNSVYSQLGIRSGDVIHSVNGTKIDNQRKALELLDSMRREKQVVIEIERRGKRQNIEYNIQ